MVRPVPPPARAGRTPAVARGRTPRTPVGGRRATPVTPGVPRSSPRRGAATALPEDTQRKKAARARQGWVSQLPYAETTEVSEPLRLAVLPSVLPVGSIPYGFCRARLWPLRLRLRSASEEDAPGRDHGFYRHACSSCAWWRRQDTLSSPLKNRSSPQALDFPLCFLKYIPIFPIMGSREKQTYDPQTDSLARRSQCAD
jgi:hypothetical protein